VAEKAGASFELDFTGRAVGIAVAAGPDAGILHYSIDNKPEQSVDLFTQWSSVLYIPWYHLLDDQLKKGKHILKVRVSAEHHPESTGNACRIVHFLVNE
jgi:sialidase-1